MPALAAFGTILLECLLWLFRSRLGYFIVTILVWLGFNFGTVHVVIEPLMDLIKNSASNIQGAGPYGPIAVQWMKFLNFDKAISMVLSAYVARQSVVAGRMFLFKATAPGAP